MENPWKVGDAVSFNIGSRTLTGTIGAVFPKVVRIDYVDENDNARNVTRKWRLVQSVSSAASSVSP